MATLYVIVALINGVVSNVGTVTFTFLKCTEIINTANAHDIDRQMRFECRPQQ